MSAKSYLPMSVAVLACAGLLVMVPGSGMAADGNLTLTNDIGMRFVFIPPGTFMMGSPQEEPGRNKARKTRHKVTLTRGFHMQTTEVTQGQWKAVMGNNPSWFRKCGDDCPVENVSWDDVREFVRKLNRKEGTDSYRLPTEAEWEYSCRAGTNTPFSFGKCLSTDEANFDGNYPIYSGNYPLEGCSKGEKRGKTVPVASFAPNAWGLYDMHGNVWEWCQDWSADYPASAVTNPMGPDTGSYRIYRGGSWNMPGQRCRSESRCSSRPRFRCEAIGFRLVREAP